jgi:DHA1 family bicyclomycin/chloramphenicol resistance-like MFS transporter
MAASCRRGVAAGRIAPMVHCVNTLPLILGMLAAFAPLSIDMYLPALPDMAAALGTDTASAQVTVAAYFLGMACGQIVYGPLMDRHGRKAPLYVGVGLFVLASIACSMAGSLSQMIVFRVLQALGGCAGMVVARAVVRDVAHLRDPVRLMGRLMLVMGAAPMLAPFLGGVVAHVAGWRAIFLVLACFGGLALAMVIFVLPETLPEERRRRVSFAAVLADYARLLTDWRMLRPGLTTGFASGAMFAYIAGSPSVLMEVHGIPASQFGIWFGLNAFGLIMMSQFTGKLAEWLTRERLISILMLILLADAVLLFVASWLGAPFFVIFGCLFVIMACMGVVFPVNTVIAMQHFATVAGTASAILGTLQFGIGALSGVVMGAWSDGTGMPMASMMVICFSMAALVWFRR